MILRSIVKIENIVSSGSLNCKIDLKKLSEQCEHVYYGHNKYPGGYVRFDDHSITIYRTGKYIMPGMTSFEEMDSCFHRFLEILSPFLDTSRAERPEVRNLVCSSNTGFPLNLSLIYLLLSQMDYDVVYEPESFPGLILKSGDATFNVFGSGKYLILGCKTIDSANQADANFLSLINEFQDHRMCNNKIY